MALVTKVVEWTKPHGLYQRNDAGEWYVWRGKRCWLRVRKAEMILALEAM
jgi:hypothetical protein